MSAFQGCDETDKDNSGVVGAVSCFSLQHQRFQSIILGSKYSGRMVGQSIVGAGSCGRGCSHLRRWETKTKEPGTRCNLQRLAPSDLLLLYGLSPPKVF